MKARYSTFALWFFFVVFIRATALAQPAVPATTIDNAGAALTLPDHWLSRAIENVSFGEQPKGPAPTPGHTGIRAMARGFVTDLRHLPSRTNLYWTLTGGALAAAVHPLDDNVQSHMLGNETADKIFKPGQDRKSTRLN